MSDFVSHTMAAGLTNSAAIHTFLNKDTLTKNLYVWGENADQRLFEKPKGIKANDSNEVIR